MLHSRATGVRTALTLSVTAGQNLLLVLLLFYSDIFVIVVTSGMNLKLSLQQDNKNNMFRVTMNFP